MVTLALDHPQTATKALQPAEAIPPVDKVEAAQIARFELQQVLNLLEQLEGADWTQPTECTAWNVQRMAAHLAGGCAGWANWRNFSRQMLFNPYLLQMPVPVDAINRREVEDRQHMSPPELIAELREVGEKAVRNRQRLPEFLRKIEIPASPMPGKMSFAYLADVVYPRDQWMHRMDLCRATGKAWDSHPEHDARLMALIMLDIAKNLAGRLNLVVHVTGVQSYRFGQGASQAELTIDLLTLNRRSSGRINADEALKLAEVAGDWAVAKNFLESCEVLY